MNEAARSAIFAYDQVAYPTSVIAHQTIDYIAAAAMIHGHSVPDLRAPRVLEIGCGSGDNLLSMAAICPDGHFMGFDLAAGAIAEGKALARAAGLGNVELTTGDIRTWPRGGEHYDFIIAHGVLTWVPHDVRTALIELIAARLAPMGLVYIGYDAYPACAPKYALNRFLRAHTDHLEDPVERIETSQALLAVLKRNQTEGSRLLSTLEDALDDNQRTPRGYFYHDWLAEFYEPMSLEELAAAAAPHGLAFAGDLRLNDLYGGDLAADTMALLESTGNDPVARNTLLDLMRGTHTFRQDLLIRPDAAGLAPPAEALGRLHFSFSGTRQETEDEKGPAVVYATAGRASLTAREHEARLVLDCLNDARPAQIVLDEIVRRTGLAPQTVEHWAQRFVALGLIDFHVGPGHFVVAPSDRPRAGALVRAMAEHSSEAISLRHRLVAFDSDPTRMLITLCDGTRTRAEIAAAMSERLSADIPVSHVNGAVAHFAKSGVFEA